MWSCILCIFLLIEHSECNRGYEDCFFDLSGPVGDVNAEAQFITNLNNINIFPRIKSILERDFFRFFEVNLERGCPFFEDDKRCLLSDCHVNNCPDDNVPVGLRHTLKESHAYKKYTEEYNQKGDEINCSLSELNRTLSDGEQTIIANWTAYDSEDELTFCEPDDDRTGKLIYVDLLKNPERYTGYKGHASNKIWHMIYNENCFNEDAISSDSVYGNHAFSCLEKRAFYRMISGLHTSITVHLCYRHPNDIFATTDSSTIDSNGNSPGWGPNVEEFRRRFDPERVPDSSSRLLNLYFTYLVELRALAKAAPFLLKQTYFTGNPEGDLETKRAVTDLLEIIQSEGNLFNEASLFNDHNPESVKLKTQFRQHFRNISRIMDCVGCEKCRLWGKLQTQGMGTALKILFSPNGQKFNGAQRSEPSLHLTRTEIVTLFNAFGRLSTSIAALQDFCRLLHR